MKISCLQILFLLFSVSFFSCEEENLNSDGCEDNLVCTEQFTTISLEITNQQGEPIVLDDFYTFYDSRKKFEYQLNNIQQGLGIYPVLTDSEMDEIQKEGTTLIFVGEKDGRNIVEHQMVIGHDCCHVILIEGDDKIVIEE